MSTLNSTQRSFLERTIIRARKLAESGAEKALQNLAVENAEPYSHMEPEQRALRRRLRSKARLLGDEIINGKQQIKHLSYELAYEYWHKMLFAKFLEANNLLIHPEHQVAVSFEDCEEFAKEEGYADKWTAAAHYASHMLPAIFRPEDPLMQVDFATEDRLALEQLLESIEEEIFVANDSLGWVYQFWQSAEKERINKSEVKIDGEKLPAVTQLFTEPYMVHFLIDNSIGAWWVGRNPNVKPPVEFEYLRLLDDGTPAAGKFEGWPDTTREVTTLDPCMGSGHFIVELFNVLTPLRMFEEKELNKEEATKKVIEENLHGLEIDPRCTQIAAFNLALTAWKFNGKVIELPELNLACSGVAPKGNKEDWIKLVENEKNTSDRERMKNQLAELYDLFQLAPELGSLIDPKSLKPDIHKAPIDIIIPQLENLVKEKELVDEDQISRGIIALGAFKSIQLITKSYDLIITNFPYLGAKRMDSFLFDFSTNRYSDSRHDLAYFLYVRMQKLLNQMGSFAVVLPNNWLKAKRIKSFRLKRIKNESFRFLIDLGSGAFRQITGEVVKVILFITANQENNRNNNFIALDCSKENTIEEKIASLLKKKLKEKNQKEQLKNPESKIILEDFDFKTASLAEFADSFQGLMFKDRIRLLRSFWEFEKINPSWHYMQTSVRKTTFYTGKNLILNWEDFSTNYKELGGNYKWNSSWGKKGIGISQMSELPRTIFQGDKFDGNVDVIIPKNENDLPVMWCYVESDEYIRELRKLDPKLDVNTASLIQVPFVFEDWQKIANQKYPNGIPKPYSEDITQWLFHGHPKPSEQPLQVALSRLLDYQWPAELDKEMELSSETQKYIRKIQAFNSLADDDGIVCIPSVNGEQPAAERLRNYIKEVWQEDWDNNTIANLLKESGSSKTNLEQWLRDDFFAQHLKVFSNRPFIWHIWDGRKDGFSALVNYHKLDNALLKILVYTYLGDWIRQCDLKVKDNESGAEGLLSAAKKLKEKLELILEGEPPYDIFVRWKPAEEQPIGWEPDLNDGVRLNIYPFMQAGILRKKPNIKWGKDRGKNPPDSHWGPERFNRYEDLDDEYKLKDEDENPIPHLTNEVKRKIREQN